MKKQLLTKPRYLSVRVHDPNKEQYKDRNPPEKRGKINGINVSFRINPSPKKSRKVSFPWKGDWCFVEDTDFYDLVKSCRNGSELLEFFIETPQVAENT